MEVPTSKKLENSFDHQEEPSLCVPEIETLESWTFLDDDETNNDKTTIINETTIDRGDDTKTSLEGNLRCPSENSLSFTHHMQIDSDISDGISVISDSDSMNGRHSPILPPKMISYRSTIDDDDIAETTLTSPLEGTSHYEVVQRSHDRELEVLRSNDELQRHFVWNPTSMILFGLIVGATAILSSRYWGVNQSYESLIPQMSSLAQRIQDLESENVALKVEVRRLVELYHSSHDHFHKNEKSTEERPMKVKKVWTGKDENPIRIPKYPTKEDYCDDEYLNSEDLFATYNAKKCKNNDDLRDQRSKSGNILKKDSNNGFGEFEDRKKRNSAKDDASIKRQKFSDTKNKFVDRNESSTSNEVRSEKFLRFQEKRQKIYEDTVQAFLDRQQKLENNHEKGKLNRDGLKEHNRPHKQSEDIKSEWYDKMMKQREKLRATGSNAGRNKENWYTDRASQREKVRRKNERKVKSKQY